MANKVNYPVSQSTDMFYELTGITSSTGFFDVGYNNSIGQTYNGALRFQDVSIPQGATVISAELQIKVAVRNGSDPILAKVWGIDEDNTANFSSSPMGRTKTTASNTHYYTDSGTGWFSIGVTNVVQEIVDRAGWSSGNDIGFIVEDNGTDTGDDNDVVDVYIGGLIGNNSMLTIQLATTPNFFPTPGTVSAPTFPETDDYGLKVSKIGVDIGTASEDELLLTTRQKVFKVLNEGTLDVSSGTASYTHNLGYNPAVLGYIKGTATGETRMYKLNKIYKPYTNPDVGGYVVSGTTVNNVRTGGVGTTGFVYLYTFIDPLT